MNHRPTLTATPFEPSPPSRPRIKLVSRWLWIAYVIKTTANGRRWVCDASLSHCIPTADEKHTLKGGPAS